MLEGSIALRIGHEHRTVPAGESFDIPRGTVHTMGRPAGRRECAGRSGRRCGREEFLTEMPDDFYERLGHIQRYAEEFRLAGF